MCLRTKKNISKKIKGIFVDLHVAKTKHISVGMLYTPPNDSNFVQLVAEIVNYLNILENEMFDLAT